MMHDDGRILAVAGGNINHVKLEAVVKRVKTFQPGIKRSIQVVNGFFWINCKQ
jgi:hypothetical protein